MAPQSFVSRNKTAIAAASAAAASAVAAVTYFGPPGKKKAPAPVPTTSHPLHPSIDNGIVKGSSSFSGGVLRCKCPSNRVEVSLAGNVAHNHACGCSKCWKPWGALFSVVAVIPRDQLRVAANGDKLEIVDESAAIQRYACTGCGVHMFGRIEKDHPFKGLDFVHVELSDDKGWQEPQFAAFVSSIIEQGFDPAKMDGVRAQLGAAGLETYDALSPPLMDAIAAWNAPKSK